MTPKLNPGPFTIHELVDTIRGHWQIAGVDAGDVERSIKENPDESTTILKRTGKHLDRMVYACLHRSIRGKCPPQIHQALDEFQMSATSLAEVWRSIGDVGLNGKRTARHLAFALDRAVSAFDELQRLTKQVDNKSAEKRMRHRRLNMQQLVASLFLQHHKLDDWPKEPLGRNEWRKLANECSNSPLETFLKALLRIDSKGSYSVYETMFRTEPERLKKIIQRHTYSIESPPSKLRNVDPERADSMKSDRSGRVRKRKVVDLGG